jgi:hypothetical protein
MKAEQQQHFLQRLTGFDYFVFAGALVNIFVVFYLTGYWLIYG